MRDTLPDRVRLGVFEVDLRMGELRSAGRTVLLQEQPLQILCMLVERDGDLVSREEIQKKLWPNDTVVEFDHSINAAIKKLRQAFGDSADAPVYVETIHRRGYRLLVRVEYLATDDSSDPSVAPEAARPTERPLGATDLIGKKVSHYRVLQVIGGGGMGLVYRAEDLKLGRQVALKFLPEELAFDSVALQRFEREAQTASSLNHPNICTIYEVEEHEGQPFIVMELLEGETLRDGLARATAKQKPLPLDQLLDIAMQVSAGLEAAHKRGIIHRDIKPANIFVTSWGQVKILDFGLAKLATSGEETGGDHLLLAAAAGAGTQPAHPPMETTLTRVGAAMGTAGYMSPEQVRGEKLDPRTDIFSFGLVLYEMATGQRAFSGETAAVVQDAIVNRVPAPARELNPAITPELEAVINKALEKNRGQRHQTVAELGTDLRQLKSKTGLDHAAASSQGRRRGALWLALSFLMLLAVIAIARLLPHRAEAPPPEVKETQLTANPLDDPVTGATISPDGKYVAYHDQTGLYIQTIDSGETRPIDLPAQLSSGAVHFLSWSPAGAGLIVDALTAEGWGVWRVKVLSPPEAHLLYRSAFYSAVSPRGTMVAFTRLEQGKRYPGVWIGGTDGRAESKMAESGIRPTWSPDGRWIAYGKSWQNSQGLWSSVLEVRPVAGGPAKTLLTESSLPSSSTFLPGNFDTPVAASWDRDWRLVFSLHTGPQDSTSFDQKYSLWQVRIDPRTMQAVSKPEQLTQWGAYAPIDLSISADTKRAAYTKGRSWRDVYLCEVVGDGKLTTPHRLTLDDRGGDLDGWTPDSQAVLFDSDRNGRREIFRQGVNENIPKKLIAGDTDALWVAVTPDASSLLYLQSAGAAGLGSTEMVRLMRRPLTGNGTPEKLLEASRSEVNNFWCSSNPHARVPCILALLQNSDLVFYSLDPIHGKGERIANIDIVDQISWSMSPDGTRLAFVNAQRYGGTIKLLELEDRSWRDINTDLGKLTWIAWAPDGKSFFATFFGPEVGVAHITLDGGVQRLISKKRGAQYFNAVLPSPDGRHLALDIQKYDSNVWMIENF